MTVSLKQEVYDHVKNKLLCGALKAGDRFSMLGLARELKMSNMPVREALNQLEAEGLVQRIPNSGYAVRRLSEPEIEQLFAFRELLECHAAAACARSISRRDLGELEDICEQMREVARSAREAERDEVDPPTDWLDRLVAADFAFHRTLIRAGGNHWVAKAMEHLEVISKLFDFKRLPDDASVLWQAARYYRVHMTIVRAIRRGEVDRVQAIMKDQLASKRINAAASNPQRGTSDNRKTLSDEQLVLSMLTETGGLDSVPAFEPTTAETAKYRPDIGRTLG